MMKIYRVDGLCQVGVRTMFEDDGETDLLDQAAEALREALNLGATSGDDEVQIEETTIDSINEI